MHVIVVGYEGSVIVCVNCMITDCVYSSTQPPGHCSCMELMSVSIGVGVGATT